MSTKGCLQNVIIYFKVLTIVMPGYNNKESDVFSPPSLSQMSQLPSPEATSFLVFFQRSSIKSYTLEHLKWLLTLSWFPYPHSLLDRSRLFPGLGKNVSQPFPSGLLIGSLSNGKGAPLLLKKFILAFNNIKGDPLWNFNVRVQNLKFFFHTSRESSLSKTHTSEVRTSESPGKIIMKKNLFSFSFPHTAFLFPPPGFSFTFTLRHSVFSGIKADWEIIFYASS